MYEIHKIENCLLVKFNGNFNYSTIKQVIYEKLMMSGNTLLNVIWLVGEHRANLRLGDIQSLVDDFSKLYPKDADPKKMAFVVESGLTAAILELLSNGLEFKFPVSCRFFDSRKAAEAWAGAATSQVA